MAVYGFHESTLTGSAVAELINSAHVSSSFLSTFGAVLQLGRAFLPQESRGGEQVAILSNGLWQRHFGGDTNVLGQTIKLDDGPYTVIGVTALIFGAFPAFMASRLSPGDAIRDGTRSGRTGGVHQRRMSGFLVISEVTLALVLLLGAGLLLKTFVRLQGVNLGFNPDRILSLKIDLSEQKYPDGRKQAAYFEQIVERLRALPGVEAVGLDAALPLSGYSMGMMLSRDDRKAPQIISAGIVNTEYFRTMGIPLKKGRLFTDEDRAGMPKVALVNESFARSHFAGEDPLGKQVHDATVVGVVGDVRQGGPVGPPDPLAYFCYLQNGYRSMSLAVRTKGNPLRLISAIRAQIVDRWDPRPRLNE